MCSHHYQARTRCHKKRKKSAEATRGEFYRNLIIFCAVNAYFLWINDRFDNWHWVTIFWGMSMWSQYNKVKWALNQHPPSGDDDDIVPPPPPKWKDKDLV